METFDVVVIGAGLAGLHAARSAACRGFSVLLVDGKRRVDAGIRTTGIFVRRSLEDFALPESCLGPPVRRVRLLGPSLSGFTLESANDEFRIGRMGRLHLRLLDEAARSGVIVRLGTRYTGSADEGVTTRVELESERRTTAIRARFLLGADGALSAVAADLGLGQNAAWIVGFEEVYAPKRSSGEPHLTCLLDPRIAPGYIAWVADDGEELHVGVGGDPGRFEPRVALEQFKRRIAATETLEGAVRLERRGGLIPVGGVHERIASRCGALLGDAAGAPSPLTAGGLDPCLRLSEAVVDACARYLGGDPQALNELDGRRFRARFAGRLMMRRLVTLVRSAAIAEAAVLALRVTPLRALASHLFFAEGSFPQIARPGAFARNEVA